MGEALPLSQLAQPLREHICINGGIMKGVLLESASRWRSSSESTNCVCVANGWEINVRAVVCHVYVFAHVVEQPSLTRVHNLSYTCTGVTVQWLKGALVKFCRKEARSGGASSNIHNILKKLYNLMTTGGTVTPNDAPTFCEAAPWLKSCVQMWIYPQQSRHAQSASHIFINAQSNVDLKGEKKPTSPTCQRICDT